MFGIKTKLVKIFKSLLNSTGIWNHKYLFILSPPFCGSTLLNEILCTSPAVSVNHKNGTREGQKLSEVRAIMFAHDRRWDESLDFDWPFIKKEWMKYWSPFAPVWLEKSPPNIIRAQSIAHHFTPAYFIVLHRNPYAHCESLMRRKKKKRKGKELISATEAAHFAIQCLNYQKRNIEELDRVIQISYEDLIEQPQIVARNIICLLYTSPSPRD